MAPLLRIGIQVKENELIYFMEPDAEACLIDCSGHWQRLSRQPVQVYRHTVQVYEALSEYPNVQMHSCIDRREKPINISELDWGALKTIMWIEDTLKLLVNQKIYPQDEQSFFMLRIHLNGKWERQKVIYRADTLWVPKHPIAFQRPPIHQAQDFWKELAPQQFINLYYVDKQSIRNCSYLIALGGKGPF